MIDLRVVGRAVFVRPGLVALACAAALATATPGGGAPASGVLALETIAAAPANRAAVVIDKGDGSAPVKVCVRFDAASISGEEALRLAAAKEPSIAPVLSAFSGMGKAVCALCGIGCPAGDCFCDPQRYWAYSRVEAGTSGFLTSPVGVTASAVTDGDVEGYRWGSGAPPAVTDIRTICGEVPVETTDTTRGPVPTTPPPPAPGPAVTPGTAPPGGSPPTSAAPTTAATAEPAPAPTAPTESVGTPGAPTTTTTTAAVEPVDPEERGSGGRDPSAVADGGDDDEAGDGGDDEEAAVRLTQEGETGGGGSGLALAGVGATFAALVAGSVALQRARRVR